MSAAPADEPPTVAGAIIALASARKVRPADVGFLHGSAARIRMDVALVPTSLARAYRLLADYRLVLAELGIDYDTITPPDPTAAAAARAASVPKAGPIGRSRVWVDRRGLWLKSPFSARDVVRGQIPAADWDKKVRAYKLPPTGAAALSIAEALGAYGIDADDAATALVQVGHKSRRAMVKRSATNLPEVPGSKTVAWGHQKQAFWFARELPGAILDMEMGTGKSKVVCDIVHDSRAESVLIVCPERVVGVWPKQFGIHSGGEKHIIDPRKQNRRGEWNLLPISDRVDLYEEALHDCTCGLPHILITNYAAAGHEPFKSWSARQHLDYIAYDECHRLRSHGGVWSQWAKRMHTNAERHIGGTGTFQAQTPLDVFGQIRAVEPGLFGETFIGFKKRYAVMGGYEGKVIVDLQNEDELAEKIATVTYHAGEDVLDLPKLLPDLDVVGHLSPRAWKAYSELESEMYVEILRELEGGGEIVEEATVDNVLVRILRCMQMTGGNLQLDSGVLEEIDHGKRDLLTDVLEDFPEQEPIVVFAKFLPDLDNIGRVAHELGRPYGELSGRRSDALTEDATLSPDCTIAGVQIQAGGTGVDFTRSAFGIYYSVGYSLADFLQSKKRLHRPGQTRTVRFRHLVMEGTIDETVYQALADRKSVVERIASKVKALQAAGRIH